jgi:hypothetical protein
LLTVVKTTREEVKEGNKEEEEEEVCIILLFQRGTKAVEPMAREEEPFDSRQWNSTCGSPRMGAMSLVRPLPACPHMQLALM